MTTPDRRLLSSILPLLGPPGSRVVVGPGRGDGAVVRLPGGGYWVLTTDLLHASSDFPRGMTPWQMGWMGAAANLSDLAAHGARPLYLLVALGLPRMEPRLARGVVRGLDSCARRYGACIIGGDLDHTREVTIAATAIGEAPRPDRGGGRLHREGSGRAEKRPDRGGGRLHREGSGRAERRPLSRGGARPGHWAGHLGPWGEAMAALALRRRGRRVERFLWRRLVEPVPRVREGMALARAGVSAMTDVSDSLALSLHDIARDSRVGFRLEPGAFRPSPGVSRAARLLGHDPLSWVLYGGGDYGLLFTVPPGRRGAVERAVSGVAWLGRVAASEGIFIGPDRVEEKGYSHF
ncbi:MAG: thiamine-monophosphate kinase [Euryarchaeota archaeon]|nr:thiamine-monophosphate kinase [Euryarchaeota archaeon]